jgi:F0F1-type ATP synthase membrane subunit b/b'
MDYIVEAIRFFMYVLAIGGTGWKVAKYYIDSQIGVVSKTAATNTKSIDVLKAEDKQTDQDLDKLKEELRREIKEKTAELDAKIDEKHKELMAEVTGIAAANAEARVTAVQDMSNLRERITGETISPDTLDNRLRDLNSQLHARIGNVETNLRSDVANLRTEMNQRL